MIPAALLAGGPAGGSAPYHADAVHFDGTFWAQIAALASADSPFLTYSLWVLIPTATDPAFFFDIDPANVESGSFTNLVGVIRTPLGDATASNYLVSQTSSGAFSYGPNWHHLFVYADTNHGAGSKIIKVFVDAIDVTGTVTDADSAFSIGFNGLSLALTDDISPSGNVLMIADAADWMIYPGQLITDITIFRDAITGKPKNPDAFPQGAIMLSGNASAFLLNTLGTAGPLTTQAGTLTNASTSPSD